MPIYEYVCRDCRHEFERLRTTAERDAATVCPACAGTRAKRTISAFATLRAENRDAVPAATGSQAGGCACGGNCGCR